ncbi:hypothetical protein BpHYR1_038501 [Brachionus plicatilis]|uniref:Uncharacterized protein n=1 Tax=Brachionus plicatilis TaxID=10195 RepID=A0A3M7PPC7_BRAPC|nr:hypothetical protein BpHYR1_038501 [Brachionus plicatilis]
MVTQMLRINYRLCNLLFQFIWKYSRESIHTKDCITFFKTKKKVFSQIKYEFMKVKNKSAILDLEEEINIFTQKPFQAILVKV